MAVGLLELRPVKEDLKLWKRMFAQCEQSHSVSYSQDDVSFQLMLKSLTSKLESMKEILDTSEVIEYELRLKRIAEKDPALVPTNSRPNASTVKDPTDECHSMVIPTIDQLRTRRESCRKKMQEDERQTREVMTLQEEDFEMDMNNPNSAGHQIPLSVAKKRTEERNQLGLANQEPSHISRPNTRSRIRSSQKLREEQTKLQEDTLSMAKLYRQELESLGDGLSQDTALLQDLSEKSTRNLDCMNTETNKIKQHEQNSIGLFTRIWLICMVVLAFLFNYIIIKLFSKSI